METRAHYVLIGTAVLFTVAMGFLFILWLGQGGVDYDEYDIIFRERVSGLSKGAPVRFNGIQKGDVLDLTIDKDDPSIVIAHIRVEDDTPVKMDTKAELELVGFTGLAIIQLVGGSPDKPLLKDETRGTPRIEADTSGFAAFIEGSSDILSAANRLLSDRNMRSVETTLSNLEAITTVIASRDEEIAETIDNIAALTADLNRMSAQLAEASDELERLIGEDATIAVEEIRGLIRESRDMIANLNGVIDENSEPIALFTEQGLAQVGPAVAEARRLFRTLDQVLREIDRDPRGYILGESTPRHEGAAP